MTQPTPRRGLWRLDKHVVNTAMAIKAYALSWRLSRQETERAFPAQMLALLDRYHGQVTGMFTGDECLAGKNPVQGTELCAVVETMYSLEHSSRDGRPGLRRPAGARGLSTPCRPRSRRTCGRISMTSRSTRSNARSTRTTCGPRTVPIRTSTAWNRISAAAHPTCTKGWPKFAAHLWMRTPMTESRRWRTRPVRPASRCAARPSACRSKPTIPSAKRSS